MKMTPPPESFYLTYKCTKMTLNALNETSIIHNFYKKKYFFQIFWGGLHEKRVHPPLFTQKLENTFKELKIFSHPHCHLLKSEE
jgi:hypothetical protein